MNTGPPKKPLGLKLIQGTWRKDRDGHQPLVPPEIAAEMPEPPQFLSPFALIEWFRLAPALHAMGCLTEVDAAAFAVRCELWADFLEASERCTEHGKVIKTGERIETDSNGKVVKSGGNFIENPFFSIKKRCAELLLRYDAVFALNPGSRASMNMPGESTLPANPFAKVAT